MFSWVGQPVFGGKNAPLPPARVHFVILGKKSRCRRGTGGKMVDERQLFHSTSTGFVDAICQQEL